MTGRTMPLPLVAQVIWGEDAPASKAEWLRQQLVAGKIPGRKIGRSWRMTLEDIEAALEIWKRNPSEVVARGFGLTPNSRRRAS